MLVSGNERDNTSMIILTNRIIKLEKLQEARMQVVETLGIEQWNRTLWSQQKNPKNSLVLVIMFCGFQRAINHT
jgi:hypothetical protein